ncbi:MAG: hypothetical protein KDD22_05815 [Bdellovibrionales bacterium]|nr:hypothetical protein [Bdellovibrionales bacterium]
MAVLAHEVGHHIDFYNQNILHLNLEDAYEPVVQCLSQSKSIRLQPEQRPEALADVLSAEILAKLIPTDIQKRERFIKNALTPFCAFDSGTISKNGVEESHPFPFYRTHGIFLANPRLREKLECSTEPRHFTSCGL